MHLNRCVFVSSRESGNCSLDSCDHASRIVIFVTYSLVHVGVQLSELLGNSILVKSFRLGKLDNHEDENVVPNDVNHIDRHR